MHEKGVTINDIVEVLKRTPMHSRIIPAIKSAYDAGYFVFSLVLYLYFNLLSTVTAFNGVFSRRFLFSLSEKVQILNSDAF